MRTRALAGLLIGLASVGLLSPSHAESGEAGREWQQRVDYQLDVALHDSLRSIRGTATVTYQNHSPDTLGAIWFRLPPAARHGDAPADSIPFRGGHSRLDRIPEADWGSLEVHQARADARRVSFLQDGSIGRLLVQPPLAPGDSLRFELDFTTRFPTGRASFRIGYYRGQYKGAYWYPQVCAYTPEYGWTVYRYFGTAEQYGEFGNFTVRYTVPSRFIVASTGVLANEAEVLPQERLQALSLNNPNPPPIPEGEEGDRLVTWIYEAEMVPDVAFAMDPRFLIDRVEYDDFEAWAFVLRGREQAWDDAAEICGWTIQQLEEIYGDYPWRRVMASDSYSAMEYPMLTLMSGSTPSYAYVMIHEVVHNYTPMILHSNAADAIWMDEGFTTFVEHELSARWAGTRLDRVRTYRRGLFDRQFRVRDDVLRGARPYLEAVLPGEDLRMVRGADVAENYPLLRASSYYKGPVMLNALRGVLGEKVFWEGMRRYFEENALSHVDRSDVIRAFEGASGRPLRWFFDQFLHDSGDIDYRIEEFQAGRQEEQWVVRAAVRRVGEVRLPLRMAAVTDRGDTLRGALPFLPTDPAPDGLAVWGSWDQLHNPSDRVRFDFRLPREAGRPVKLLLHPEGRYLDRNPLDDRSPRPSPEVRFGTGLLPHPPAPVDRYRVLVEPAVGYHLKGRARAGITAVGSFMEAERLARATALMPTVWDESVQPDVTLALSHPLNRGSGPVHLQARGGWLYEDSWFELGLQRLWRAWPDGREARMAAWVRLGRWNKALQGGALQSDYLSLGFDHRKSSPWLPDHQRLRFLGSISSIMASTLEYQADEEKRIGRHFRWKSALRAARSLGSPWEPRFAVTPMGGSAYDLLGNPVFGGRWNAEITAPVARTAGSMASLPALVDSPAQRPSLFESFAVAETGIWGSLRERDIPLPAPASRFFGKWRLGVYAGGALFGKRIVADALPVQDRFRFNLLGEAGADLSLVDLYGITVSARLAPFAVAADGAEEARVRFAEGWSLDSWYRHLVLRVETSHEFFRP